MLDDISIYWLTDSAASSARFYWENARNGRGVNAGRIDLPMAATVSQREIFTTTKAWAQENRQSGDQTGLEIVQKPAAGAAKRTISQTRGIDHQVTRWR